jgi:hypothetical protein
MMVDKGGEHWLMLAVHGVRQAHEVILIWCTSWVRFCVGLQADGGNITETVPRTA